MSSRRETATSWFSSAPPRARSSCARMVRAGGGTWAGRISPASRSMRSRSTGAPAGGACSPEDRAITGVPCCTRATIWAARGAATSSCRCDSRRTPAPRSSACGRWWRGARTIPARFIAAPSQPRCSSRATAARAGRSCAACGTTLTARNGCPGAAGSACTRSFPIPCTAIGCSSRSRPAACTARTMAAARGRCETGGCGPSSCRTSTRSSASACTRSCSIQRCPSGCSSRTTGASTAAWTPPTRGRTSRTAFLRTSGSRWRRTRTTPRRCTSCRSNRTCSVARPRAGCACIARATPANRGNR